MTNEEMKQALAKGGIATADIEKISDKYDAEKITEIVEGANNPKEAFEAIHNFYPDLEMTAAASATMAGTGAAVGAAIGGLVGSIAGGAYAVTNLK